MKDTRILRQGRKWRGDNSAISIVAVITNDNDGVMIDWAAYIGATSQAKGEQQHITDVAQNGDKLWDKDAQHFFPDLPIEQYRR